MARAPKVLRPGGTLSLHNRWASGLRDVSILGDWVNKGAGPFNVQSLQLPLPIVVFPIGFAPEDLGRSWEHLAVTLLLPTG